MPPKTREIKFGKHVFRIAQTPSGLLGIVVGDSKTRFSADDEASLIDKLREHVLQQDRNFIGYEGARKRFLGLFPAGFSDPALNKGELSYKRAMARWLAENAPIEAAAENAVNGETVLRAFQRTNLVDPHTKAKLSTVLKGPRAERLIEILTRLAGDDLRWSCDAIVAEFSDDGVATWPTLTYLAFFWRPDQHVFLKPEFTKEYARRVGHRFAVEYSSQPESNTYELLLDMLEETRRHIADLNAKDFIDLHSFMWAVIMYDKRDVD